MRKKIIIIIMILLITIPAYTTNAANENLNLYSEAAILIDSETGLELYSKNVNEQMYPASTTKILTAIIAIEECDLKSKVTVSQSAVSIIPPGYSSASLLDGEILTVEDLVTVFLVHSANDAGYVLAEYISGSVEKFAEVMNQKAEEIGCKNSHFLNPSGIHDDDHYSTAYDLALIAKYCMENPTFRKIVSLKTCTIKETNKSGVRKYTNTNELINPDSKYYEEGCIGIKTGFTSQAGNCLISCVSKENLELISVVLGARQIESGESTRNLDSKDLFEYGYSNFHQKTIAQKNDIITKIKIPNGTKETRELELVLEDSVSAIIKNDYENQNPTISLNENISAPIAKGQVLGTVTYETNKVKYTKNIIASHDVEADNFLMLIFFVILIIFISLILTTRLFRKRKIKKKKKSKYHN